MTTVLARGLLLCGILLTFVVMPAMSQNKEYIYAQRDNTEIIFYIKKGDQAFNEKKFSEAAKYYTKALKVNDPVFNFIIYVKRANIYTGMGLLDNAIADYTMAIKLKPSTVVAYNNRALCYTQKGNLEKALSDQTKIINLKPKSDLFYNNRGLTFAKKKAYDSAIKDYNKAIDLDSDNSLYYYNRASAKFSKGKYAEALKDYVLALQKKKDFAAAYYYSALCKLQAKNYTSALQDLNNAVKFGGFQKEYLETRANLYVKIKRFVPALQDYNNLLKSSPRNVNFRVSRALILEKIRQDLAALNDYKAVLQLQARNYDAQVGNVRILLHQKTKDTLGLIQKLVRLSREFPTKSAAQFELAQYYLTKENYATAKKYIEKCLDLRGNYPDYLAFYSLIQFRLGNFQEAAKYLKQALVLDPDNRSFLSLKDKIPDYNKYVSDGSNSKPVTGTEPDEAALDKDPNKILPIDLDAPPSDEDEDSEEDNGDEE